MPNFERYKEYLEEVQRGAALDEQALILESLLELEDTAMCIEGTRNGIAQTFIVVRDSTTKCSLTILPNDNAYIGDLIGILDDYWLVMERQIDEYGIITATIWLCNHKLVFQNFKGDILERWMIVDDGSAQTSSDGKINIVNGNLTCYIPFDDETRTLHVDKRLALEKVYNASGELELQVWKVTWFDTKTKNFGEGSHVLTFRLEPDQFNKVSDNVDLMICDYKEPSSDTDTDNPNTEEPGPVEPDDIYYLKINGSETIRIGASRQYTVSVVDEDGNEVEKECELDWSDSNLPQGVTIETSGMSLTLNVSTDVDEGAIIVLICNDVEGVIVSDSLEVEVV